MVVCWCITTFPPYSVGKLDAENKVSGTVAKAHYEGGQRLSIILVSNSSEIEK